VADEPPRGLPRARVTPAGHGWAASSARSDTARNGAPREPHANVGKTERSARGDRRRRSAAADGGGRAAADDAPLLPIWSQ
jgi:hypothetical protein